MNRSLTKRSALAIAGLLACGATLHSATGLDSLGQLQPVAPAPADAFAFVRLDHGVQLRVAGLTKNILFYGPGIVQERCEACFERALPPGRTKEAP